MEATEKQVKLLLKNGFEYEKIAALDKKGVSDEISKIYEKKGWGKGEPEKTQQKGLNQPQTARHDIVVTRTEKPHSYEFGKSGDRHKIYYNDVKDLQAHIEELKTVGLIKEYEIEQIPEFS